MADSRVPSVALGTWRSGCKTSGQRGYDYRWQKARAEFLLLHPYCVYCVRDARIGSAGLAEIILECAHRGLPLPYGNIVDHRIPHRGDQVLFWDRSNWQTLCASHHSGAKQYEEASFLKKKRL